MSSDIDPQKLKVVELRAELSSRGLDTKGNKAVLVKRLQQALNQERGDESEGEEEEEAGAEDTSQSAPPDDAKLNTSQESESNDPATQEEQASISEKEEEEEEEPPAVKVEEEEEEEEGVPDNEPEEVQETKDDENSAMEEEAADVAVNGTSDNAEVKEEPEECTEAKPAAVEELNDEQEKTEIKQEPPDEVKAEKEHKVDERPHTTDTDHHHHRRDKRRISPLINPDRKRHHSHSDSFDRKRSHSRTPPKQEEPTEEPFNEAIVALDTYDSDLNMTIDKTRYLAIPFTEDGFGLMWAGVRAMYGFRNGQICFEVKILKHLDISHLPSEPDPHVVRVGVSVAESTLQLGEDPQSYGYGGTGKASTNCQFKDYGSKFGEGDVIGCFVDLESDPVTISYTKNGDFQGIGYSIPKEQIGNKALFPHILTKNCSFEVNFGQKGTPYYPLPDNLQDYTFANCVPTELRVRGNVAPAKRSDCEMIMMCGLPGSGKSTWAANFCAQHREKYFYVLGTNNIIDKMKVMGLPRKRNYAGRWDVLIDKSTKCLNKLLEASSRLRRNLILDQTNVYATAQRRKMRPFEGFKRRAVVLVPADEEFKRRISKREKEEGKDVPEIAVLEMKANFTLPEVGPVFESIEYVELPEEEARPLVEQYRREGRAALPPPEKRFRPADRGPQERSGGGGGGRYPAAIVSRDRDRGRMDDRRYPPNRGNYNSMGRGGGSNSNYGYRDNRNMRGGGGGNYNRGPPGPGRPMNRSGPPSRPGRGPPQQGNRNSYSGYNSRDRGYQQSNKQDYKSGQSQGYGQSGYGSGNYSNHNYQGYQGYGYGQQGYGQQQQQQQSYGQQWKQSQGSYPQSYSSGYSQQGYSQQQSQPAQQQQQQQVQQQHSGYSQQSQPAQQQQQSQSASQAYYNQQYYNQQWNQWNQQNQQYYNQYYPYYGQQGYGGYQQQSSSSTQQQQQK